MLILRLLLRDTRLVGTAEDAREVIAAWLSTYLLRHSAWKKVTTCVRQIHYCVTLNTTLHPQQLRQKVFYGSE